MSYFSRQLLAAAPVLWLACQPGQPAEESAPGAAGNATGGASAGAPVDPARPGGSGGDARPGIGGSPGTGSAPGTGGGGTASGGAPASSGGSPGAGGPGGAPATDPAGARPDASFDAATTDAALPAPAAGGRSVGCGMKNPGGMFTISAGAAQTTYRIVLPASYDGEKPYPVVFYLHGRGNGIEGQGNLNRDIAMANLGIVVYPKSFGGSGWEVPGRDRPEENVALLRAIIERLATQYCIDRKKIVLTGFSSGCWFASRLACTMKDELAGIVAAACGLAPTGRCEDKKPVTYIIGRGDNAFSGAPAAAEFYRTRNGCMAGSKPAMTPNCQLYDGCASGFPATYCPHPGGHQWPGFASQAVVELLGKL